MSLTRIGSIGINTGIAFAGVTTIVTLNTANDALSIGATVNVGSGITLGASGDIFATGVSTVTTLKVGSGVTVSSDGDGFYTGVVTATTFSGALAASNLTGALPAISGANLTNLDASDLASGTVPTARLGSGTASSSTFLRGDSTFAAVTSTTINNNANNRVITGSGTANTLEGEANLTFEGDNLLLKSSTDGRRVSFAGDGTSHYMKYDNTLGGIILNGYGGITFETNGTNERLLIDSSGRILIGTTTEGNGDADEFTIANVGGGNMGMTIRSATGALGNIFFSDGTSGDSEYRGMIQYGHNNDSMRFSTSATERARIDSSGKFNVGGTTSDAKFTVIDSSNPDIAMRYNGTDGGHATRLLFMDKRGVINAQVANNLQNDGVGTAAAHLEFATATGGTLSTAVRITDDGHVRKLRQPIFGYRGGSAWTTISNGQSPALALNTAVISSSDYNTSNYRFTAPTTGYYWFGCNLYTKHASMDTSSPHYISGGIRINGASQTESNTIQHYQNASDGDTGYFISLFHYLNASDYASIVLNANGADFQYYGAHCYFYGWLVA